MAFQLGSHLLGEEWVLVAVGGLEALSAHEVLHELGVELLLLELPTALLPRGRPALAALSGRLGSRVLGELGGLALERLIQRVAAVPGLPELLRPVPGEFVAHVGVVEVVAVTQLVLDDQVALGLLEDGVALLGPGPSVRVPELGLLGEQLGALALDLLPKGLEEGLRVHAGRLVLGEGPLKGEFEELELLLEGVLLLVAEVDELLLHLVDEVDALLEGVHDGVAVHLELPLVEVVDHLVQQPVLLLDTQLRPFVVLERQSAQQLPRQLTRETQLRRVRLARRQPRQQLLPTRTHLLQQIQAALLPPLPARLLLLPYPPKERPQPTALPLLARVRPRQPIADEGLQPQPVVVDAHEHVVLEPVDGDVGGERMGGGGRGEGRGGRAGASGRGGRSGGSGGSGRGGGGLGEVEAVPQPLALDHQSQSLLSVFHPTGVRSNNDYSAQSAVVKPRLPRPAPHARRLLAAPRRPAHPLTATPRRGHRGTAEEPQQRLPARQPPHATEREGQTATHQLRGAPLPGRSQGKVQTDLPAEAGRRRQEDSPPKGDRTQRAQTGTLPELRASCDQRQTHALPQPAGEGQDEAIHRRQEGPAPQGHPARPQARPPRTQARLRPRTRHQPALPAQPRARRGGARGELPQEPVRSHAAQAPGAGGTHQDREAHHRTHALPREVRERSPRPSPLPAPAPARSPPQPPPLQTHQRRLLLPAQTQLGRQEARPRPHPPPAQVQDQPPAQPRTMIFPVQLNHGGGGARAGRSHQTAHRIPPGPQPHLQLQTHPHRRTTGWRAHTPQQSHLHPRNKSLRGPLRRRQDLQGDLRGHGRSAGTHQDPLRVRRRLGAGGGRSKPRTRAVRPPRPRPSAQRQPAPLPPSGQAGVGLLKQRVADANGGPFGGHRQREDAGALHPQGPQLQGRPGVRGPQPPRLPPQAGDAPQGQTHPHRRLQAATRHAVLPQRLVHGALLQLRPQREATRRVRKEGGLMEDGWRVIGAG